MTLRIAIRGPGQVGRAVLRAAIREPDMEVVGVKARRERPDGLYGVPVTTSKQELLDLRPDCVVVTPAATAIYRGLDDVIDLLEGGSNVVSTAAYHSPFARNWASGKRAPVERLLEACHIGGRTLHGTGVHPTLMVERVVLTLAQMLDEVDRIRFVEAADFSGAGAMWGGLAALGFGADPGSVTADHLVARGGDLYYGDVITNVAEALFGAAPGDVRIEREYRALPAAHDVQLGEVTIAAGTTGAVHLLHHGYLDDHRFFTNEECWYLRDACAFRGDDLPFGGVQHRRQLHRRGPRPSRCHPISDRAGPHRRGTGPHHQRLRPGRAPVHPRGVRRATGPARRRRPPRYRHIPTR